MPVGTFEQRSDLKGIFQDWATYSDAEFLPSIGETMGSIPSTKRAGGGRFILAALLRRE